MKLNIFQKIAFLVYISIILLIFIYFVPFQNKSSYTFHSSIMSEGYGTMSYFRFLIYLLIPTVFIRFVNKYLEKMNSLESRSYKKKAKSELYVFVAYVCSIIGSMLFLNIYNQYTEFRKEQLKSQISEINNSFDVLKEELNKRPPLDLTSAKEILEESKNSSDLIIPPLPKGFTVIKKPVRELNLDLGGYYYETYKKNVDEVLKKTSNSGFTIIKSKQLEINIKELIDNGFGFDDLNKMTVDYLEVFSENGIKKTNLELELKKMSIYNDERIQEKIVLVFLVIFILVYIIRPLFLMFRGMLKEVG